MSIEFGLSQITSLKESGDRFYDQTSHFSFLLFLGGLCVLFLCVAAHAQESPKEIDISGQWFLSYEQGENSDNDVSRFYAHRGYLTFKSKFSPSLSARITPDLTIDNTGDVKVRLKYIYMNFALPTHSLFTEPYIEFGLAHRAWLDFEEHVNVYRMQGTMFLERNNMFNSADFGITLVTLLGGKMDDTYQKEVSDKYAGKYGSIAIGAYNGGGYHALENNTNKVLEGRFTLRPVPVILPGLQISYIGVYGKGNIAAEPDWTLNSMFLSYEHQRAVATVTLFKGKGNFRGTAIDGRGEALDQSGYSLFGELKLPNSRFSLIGRYDSFIANTSIDRPKIKRTIAGVAYGFQGHHKALLDYDFAENDTEETTMNSLLKFTIEVNF